MFGKRLRSMARCRRCVAHTPSVAWLFGSRPLQQDFPFYIRIPESIPPSIALEKGGESDTHNACASNPKLTSRLAGIRYELIAAVCLKGKRYVVRVTPCNTSDFLVIVVCYDATSQPLPLRRQRSLLTSTSYIPLGPSISSQRRAAIPRAT